jgi:hypothetical protein
MATGRWQPSATKGAIWDAYDWGLGPEADGSVAGVTTSAGTAIGTEGDRGVVTGITTSSSTTLGVLNINAEISGITESIGTAQGTKPSAPSRPGYFQRQPVPVFKQPAPAFAGAAAGRSFAYGAARGAQGFAGRSVSTEMLIEGRATRSSWGYNGKTKATTIVRAMRVRGWGRTHAERQREEDLLVLNLR